MEVLERQKEHQVLKAMIADEAHQIVTENLKIAAKDQQVELDGEIKHPQTDGNLSWEDKISEMGARIRLARDHNPSMVDKIFEKGYKDGMGGVMEHIF